jgi:hypothetical protein
MLVRRSMPRESYLTSVILHRVAQGQPLIPVKAGIHLAVDFSKTLWIPAFAGMTALRFWFLSPLISTNDSHR